MAEFFRDQTTQYKLSKTHETYLSQFVSSGSFRVLTEWIKNGRQESAEKISDFVYEVTGGEKAMVLREYSEEKDFEKIKEWVADPMVHMYWCAGNLSNPLERREFNTFLQEDADRIPLVAEDDGEAVGFFIYCKSAGSANVLIRFFVVDGSKRGKGCGRKILQLAGERAKKEGFDALELDVFAENPKAVKCYEHTGFRIQEDVNCDIMISGKLWPRHHMKYDL